MRPELGFVDFISFLSPCSSFHLNCRPPNANLRMTGLARGLFFKDSLAPLLKDPTQTAANHALSSWDKKTRELAKKKAIRKQQAEDRGEETSSEDDDDDDESDEEAAGVDWGDLVDEDSLPT